MFTGYDEIDLQVARELNLVVTNVPTYGTAPVGPARLRPPCWNSAITWWGWLARLSSLRKFWIVTGLLATAF
jgi:D-isomer specific 2-hydroxyacid dehydrogenase, catalytic domain